MGYNKHYSEYDEEVVFDNRDIYMYLRKSRKDMKAEKFGEHQTLAKHKKILLDLADRLKIHIKEENILEELVSGVSIDSREEMKKLLDYISAGLVGAVMVVDIDRLTRGSGSDQDYIKKAFQYNNVKLITPTHTYDFSKDYDIQFLDMAFNLSNQEYKAINKRQQRGREIASLEGKYVANVPPFGYNIIPLKNSLGFTLGENPTEASIVEKIFELYTNGEENSDGSIQRFGTTLIAKRLNDEGIKPRKKDSWSATTIRNILQNPVYCGKIRWNARKQKPELIGRTEVIRRPRNKSKSLIIADGIHKGIIAEETWNLAQDYMTQNTPQPVPSNKKLKNPLAGLIKCKICGNSLSRRPYNSGQEPTLMCTTLGCKNVSSRLCLVEEKVISSLKEIVDKYEIDINNGKPTLETKKSQTRIKFEKLKKEYENEINTLKKQESYIVTRIETEDYDELYNKDYAYERWKKVKEQLLGYSNKVEKIEQEILLEEQRKLKTEIMIPALKRITELYYELPSIQAKNDILKEMIEVIYYEKNVNCRWHGNEDDFHLEITLKIH